MNAQQARRLVQFGGYELDIQTGELRKHGVKVKLQGKPFQILHALLEKPGEVVTREELKQRLWPGDTFVDFESGLNTAANRLRLTLGDSADSPRFVETLARSGYRFIGVVEEMERVPAAEPVLEAPPAVTPATAPAPGEPAIARRSLLQAGLGFVAGTAAAS
ncbi:MAG: winged helix-turn-helix domain-containing protein, partial [Bryobacteraceae bacterium]